MTKEDIIKLCEWQNLTIDYAFPLAYAEKFRSVTGLGKIKI